MKIHKGRGQRFAAVPNETVDDYDNLDLIALGLLTHLLRYPDGWQDDIESIARKRGPGREQSTKAMRRLVDAGYVVKVKYQSTSGKWATDSFVFDLPAEDHEVAELLDDYQSYRAFRVEPSRFSHLATRRRPTETRNSVMTSNNTTNHQVAPTDGKPTVGEPIIGEPSAHPNTVRKTVTPESGEPEEDIHTETDEAPSTAGRTSPLPSEPVEDTYTDTARSLIASLEETELARIEANKTQRAQLEDDCLAALARGVAPEVLADYLPAKVTEARTVKYVRTALSPDRLPAAATLASLGLAESSTALAPPRPTKPTWCGEKGGVDDLEAPPPCNSETRWREPVKGAAYKCPDCHPDRAATVLQAA